MVVRSCNAIDINVEISKSVCHWCVRCCRLFPLSPIYQSFVIMIALLSMTRGSGLFAPDNPWQSLFQASFQSYSIALHSLVFSLCRCCWCCCCRCIMLQRRGWFVARSLRLGCAHAFVVVLSSSSFSSPFTYSSLLLLLFLLLVVVVYGTYLLIPRHQRNRPSIIDIILCAVLSNIL